MTIYFIQPEGEPFVKIGYAAFAVAMRVNGLQVGNHRKLKLLGTRAGDVCDEEAIHRKFRKYHHRGEWFHLVPEIIEFIGPQENNPTIARVEFYQNAYGNPKRGAPQKFTPKMKAEARKLIAMTETRVLVKKARGGKVISVKRPVWSKLEIAAKIGVSAGTLHAWIRGGMK